MDWTLLIGMCLGIVIYWLAGIIYNRFKCDHEWVEIPNTKYSKCKHGKVTKTTVLTYCPKCGKTKTVRIVD